MVRELTAVSLSALLALSPTSIALAAPSVGTVEGQVTVEGKPLSGMGLAVVDLQSGAITRTKSDAKGKYRVQVGAGDYVLTSVSLAGLGVGRAPTRIRVEAGKVASASLDLMKLAMVWQDPPPVPTPGQEPEQTPPAPSGPITAGNITHDPIGCLIAGQFPLIEATIEPSASVARARVYFKSALGSAYYFVEMTLVDGKFVGKLPKPKVEASPITYYIQATTTEFGESQTPEISAQVVADESECPQGLKVAPIGPAGAVTVFSASTAAIAVPVGFAAGGLALAGGTIALILGGAALVVGGATQIGGGDTTTVPTTTTTGGGGVTTTTPGTTPPTTPPTTTLPPPPGTSPPAPSTTVPVSPFTPPPPEMPRN